MKQNLTTGEEIIGTLYKLVMAVKLHGNNNRIVKECSERFVSIVQSTVLDDGYVSIKIYENRFYLQEEKMKYKRESTPLINNALDFFEIRQIGGITIQYTTGEVPYNSLYQFALLLNQSKDHETPVDWLTENLENEENISFIVISPLEKPEEDIFNLDDDYTLNPETETSRKEHGQKTYANALASIKHVADKISGKSIAGIRKTQRVVQNMVDLIIEDESILMGMSTIRDYDDYTYCHSVNVSILSMCLGLHVGLSRDSVEILGICGLFHDLGKVDIPLEIIKKPFKLSEDETKVIEKHTLYSVTKILRLNAPRELKNKILLSPFEHHIKYDLSGYPRLPQQNQVSLFGRILTIVDVFDAITSPRVYRPDVFSPDEALGKMFEGSGTNFDPLLLKAFVNMVGIYPIGTILTLDTGELGLVSGRGNCSSGIRPEVIVLEADEKEGYKKGPILNLEERDSQKTYLRNIIDSFHPSRFGIQPAQYLY